MRKRIKLSKFEYLESEKRFVLAKCIKRTENLMETFKLVLQNRC